MVKKNFLIKSVLAVLMLIVCSMSETSAQTTNNSESNLMNEIELSAFGQGKDKDDATKRALLSALEQTYGAYVSSNTTVFNDSIVRDEIYLASGGFIKSYKYISEANENGKYEVTLSVVLSPKEVVSYAKSTGMEISVNYNAFVMKTLVHNMQIKNWQKTYYSLLSSWEKRLDEFNWGDMYDFKITLGEPHGFGGNRIDAFYQPITVTYTRNNNNSGLAQMKKELREFQELSIEKLGENVIAARLDIERLEDKYKVTLYDNTLNCYGDFIRQYPKLL